MTAERVANTVGTANGAAVTVVPHRLQMRSLVIATKLFIPHFRKLDQHFADGGQPHLARAPFRICVGGSAEFCLSIHIA